LAEEGNADAAGEDGVEEAFRTGGEKEDERLGRGFFERFEKGVHSGLVDTLGVLNNSNLCFAGCGGEVEVAFEFSDLIYFDLAAFRLRADEVNVFADEVFERRGEGCFNGVSPEISAPRIR